MQGIEKRKLISNQNQTMKNYFLSILFIVLSATLLPAQNLITDTTETTISFKIKNLGLNVEGSFSEFMVTANFEEQNLQNSYFNGIVVVKSIDTGINARDNHLKKEDYFHQEKFPEIQLTTDKLEQSKNDQYDFTGRLTIKGKTKMVKFPITIKNTGKSLMVKGNFEIDRLDFEVGESSWILKKKVKISIKYKGNFK